LEQGRYRAKAEKMLLEEIDYQNEIQRLDNEVEELSQEKQYLIRELAKYKEKYGESI
jgi:peptidoglycan hydrolase CwlO-like protein